MKMKSSKKPKTKPDAKKIKLSTLVKFVHLQLGPVLLYFS